VEEKMDLPEIPPVELPAALRWTAPTDKTFILELGMRYAHKQNRINEEFGENETPSFAVAHVRALFIPVSGWEVELGIENLLNRNYHEHLTREALLPVGDLTAGDEIPAPGRTFVVSTRYRW
jgi:outer membrane receptor for ferrienterochelin and colicin